MKINSEGEMAGLPREVGEAIERRESAEDVARQSEAMKRLVTACNKALRGELPRDFEPTAVMPKKLNQHHISMVMDEALGLTPAELSAKYEYNVVYVQAVLRHPDAITLKSMIVGARADKLIDVSSRLEHLAPEALSIKVSLMRTAEKEQLRDKIATDILAMAGYGERKQVDVEHSHKIVMPAQAATGLTTALEESRRVRSTAYSQFLLGSSGRESEVADGGAPALQLGAEHTEAGSLPSVSPTPPATPELVRVA